MPIEVITGPIFLDSQLGSGAASTRRLYHLERGELIAVTRLLDSRVASLDTLIVVNCDDPAFANNDELDRLWQQHGCALRRLEHTGMPATQRRALSNYVQ